ncbi:MAG: hypothetical protein AAGA30_02835 [Planctomycetota bacterium]
MIKRSKLICCLLVVLLTGQSLSPTSIVAQDKALRVDQNRKGETASKKQLSRNERQFVKLLPKLKKFSERRKEIVIRHVNKVRSIVNKYRKVNKSAFVDEMLSIDSMLLAAGSKQQLKNYIAKKLKNLVVDVESVAKEIQQEVFDSLHRELQDITNSTLISCKIDSELDPRSIESCRVDSIAMRRNLDQQHERLIEQFYQSVVETLVSTGISSVVAPVITNEIQSAIGDSGNSNDWFETLGEVILTAGVEMLAEEAVSSVVFETRKKLSSATSNVVSELLTPLTGNGNTLRGCDDEIVKMANRFEVLTISEICRTLDVEAEFAAQQLYK